MVIPAPNVLAENLSEVFTHFANNVQTHEFENGYNFIESQQDVQFIERILRAFGWGQNHIDEFAFHEHPLNRTRPDSDLNDEGIEVVTSKTWADYWISSGEGAVIELKSPNNANGNPRTLTEENRQQLEEYWSSFPGGVRPRYLILSNFRTFQIYDSLHPDLTVQEIVVEFTLEQIYDYRGYLPFLNIQNPSAEFIAFQEQMGESVADTMSDARLYMINELGLGEDRATLFLMQIGLLMFLEDNVDINLTPVIPRAPSTRGVLHQLLIDIDQNNAMSPLLFTLMREGGQVGNDGQYGMPEVSQDWYSADSCVDFTLDGGLITYLLELVSYNWSTISPTMFGAFLEAGFSPEQRRAGGVHYTRVDDIERIVQPLIDDYFLSLIHSYVLQANGDARFSRAEEILEEVTLFRILEPAVGCGNFLYTAYTHLSRIESYLHRIMAGIQPGYTPFVRLTPSRMIGYEINSYSAMVSRMVMAIADFEIRRTQFALPLPLSSGENSATIIQHDSLLDGDEIRDWHEAEIIIGNPPFMGLNRIRQILGVQYADRLNHAFGELAPNVNIDYVCYFILLASRMVEEGNCRAFGFITTHAVGGPINRAVIRQSLNNGLRIPFAYRRREWVGDAGVSISIFAMESPVNRQVTGTRLASSFNGDIVTVDLPINEYLDIRDLTVYTNPIPGQSNLCFQSVKGSYKGRGGSPLRLVLTDEEAEGLLALDNGEDGPQNSDVVVRYVGGKYAGDRELGWILNFRAATMEEAACYVHPFQFVYDTRRLGVFEWINPEYQENPGPLGVSYSTKAAEYNMQDRWWTIRDHCEAQFGPLREMATNFYLKHQTYAREARSHLIHIEQVPNNYTPDGTYYVFNFGDHETWRVGVLLSGYYGQWSSVTQGWTDNFGSTWRPGESFNGFPFPQDPSLQHINSMNGALEAYYNRITELEGQFETFQQVLNAAALLPFRNAIDQVVQTMYGFPNDDQVLSNLTDYKARVLLITERNTIQESLQTLTTVPGLGEATVQLLTEAGILDYHQLIQVGVVGLQAVDGIGPAGATRYVAHATEVLNRLEEINQSLNQHADG